jgi:T5orf172 domain
MQMHQSRPNAKQLAAREKVTGTELSVHYCMVYAIAASEDGPTKIGVSQNIQSRVAQLQIGSWEQLKPYGFRLALPKSGGTNKISMAASLKEGAFALEKHAHKVLREMGLGLTREWFDVTPSEALAVLDKCGQIGHVSSLSLSLLAAAESNSGLDARMRHAHLKLLRALATVNVYVKRAIDDPGLDDDSKVI